MLCRRQSRSQRQLWPPPSWSRLSRGACIVGGYRKQRASVHFHELCPKTRHRSDGEPLGVLLWWMLLTVSGQTL